MNCAHPPGLSVALQPFMFSPSIKQFDKLLQGADQLTDNGIRRCCSHNALGEDGEFWANILSAVYRLISSLLQQVSWTKHGQRRLLCLVKAGCMQRELVLSVTTDQIHPHTIRFGRPPAVWGNVWLWQDYKNQHSFPSRRWGYHKTSENFRSNLKWDSHHPTMRVKVREWILLWRLLMESIAIGPVLLCWPLTGPTSCRGRGVWAVKGISQSF